jgi:hypothetical protein
MIQFLTALAAAAPPTPIDPASMPVFPDRMAERIDVTCLVEMVSESDGRLQVLSVSGCEDPYAQAVRDRLSWMTWRTPAPLDGEPLESTYALLTGFAGVPGGLYVRMGFAFEKRPGEEPTVSIVPQHVVAPKKDAKILLPRSLESDVAEGCVLLVHVDESGRTARVQAQTCSERVRAALELPLMAWTWQPLVIEGEARSFAATFRFAPEHLMERVAD